jgi:hypothetical protein
VQGAWEVARHWQGPQHANLVAPGAASTAVIAALSFWDYSLVTPPGTGSDTYKATGRCFSVAAGRVSFVHGFKGAYDYPCPPQRSLRPVEVLSSSMGNMHGIVSAPSCLTCKAVDDMPSEAGRQAVYFSCNGAPSCVRMCDSVSVIVPLIAAHVFRHGKAMRIPQL